MYPDRDELEEAFHLFVLNLERTMAAECYLAAVVLALAIPDVCGALEEPSGHATGATYKRWCERHLPNDPRLRAVDRWKLRCSVLHQGSTKAEAGQYASYSFLPPGTAPGNHLAVKLLSDGSLNLAVDIEVLVDETIAALRDWFDWLQAAAQTEILRNVSCRLTTVISDRPKELGDGTTHYYNMSSTDYKPSWQVDSA
jgi:hypothetical protein